MPTLDAIRGVEPMRSLGLIAVSYRNGAEWYDLHPLVRRAVPVQKRLAGG